MMDLPVEAWYRAIPVRTSRRSFEARLPKEETLARLEKTCREFRPFPETRAELVRGPSAGVFKGVIGSYGRITGANCYFAFIGDMRSARVQECAGYTGEGLILEATSLGLGTCWVGGFFGCDAVSAQVPLDKSEKVLAISPVGYALAKPSFTDKTFKIFAGSRSRKPLSELIPDAAVADPGIQKGFEAARAGPSARNRQPWRFRLEDGSVIIGTDKDEKDPKISRRLDCGIAMLHFELGARAGGLSGTWDFLPPPDVAKFKTIQK
jgi:hypothetical protein